MEETIEYDGSPAFHKMGFDDKEDYEVLQKLKKYRRDYKVYIAREELGDNKNIHMPETEINPPTPFL